MKLVWAPLKILKTILAPPPKLLLSLETLAAQSSIRTLHNINFLGRSDENPKHWGQNSIFSLFLSQTWCQLTIVWDLENEKEKVFHNQANRQLIISAVVLILLLSTVIFDTYSIYVMQLKSQQIISWLAKPNTNRSRSILHKNEYRVSKKMSPRLFK